MRRKNMKMGLIVSLISVVFIGYAFVSGCSDIDDSTGEALVEQKVSALCEGTPGGWVGCRGNGCSVCDDAADFDYYDLYFLAHPTCSLNTTCDGYHFLCNAACPEPGAADTSSGSTDSWRACRGSGIYVCEEKVAGYSHYFDNHPLCRPNSTCSGLYFWCSAACPAPTSADL